MRYPALLLASLLLSACGGATATPAAPVAPSTSPAASSDLKAPGDAKIGDRTRCPVSGEEFTVTADSPHADYQGKTYYFCCPHCPERFSADPSKYLGKPSS
jgi:YHS domain-containing protein